MTKRSRLKPPICRLATAARQAAANTRVPVSSNGQQPMRSDSGPRGHWNAMSPNRKAWSATGAWCRAADKSWVTCNIVGITISLVRWASSSKVASARQNSTS
ncbi:hypothetical protein X946_1849 [Burkholderia sp. ABCPW 111]|nr:hypothetical protein X946_1849 [Burkholderia sp. ABCPW 111]